MAGTSSTIASNGSSGASAVAATNDPVAQAAEAFSKAQQKYTEERAKRIKENGLAQYVNETNAPNLDDLWEDPWAHLVPASRKSPDFQQGTKTKVLIQGAGFGGLLFAVRLLQQGFKPEDIILVDSAGSFGGTWYWNRYPGLMCDVEAACYLPLLEETGYIPKHRYSYGYEILEHCQRIAEKWQLTDRGVFGVQVKSLEWDDAGREWKVQMTKKKKGGEEFEVKAQFVISTAGLLNFPQVPNISGVQDFQGPSFHTSRWNYQITGGSPTDWTLDGLKGKKVGIIGTGATAIQAVPHLAKYASELFVFQRTPSGVDERGQVPIDPKAWTEKIANKKGWQQERTRNFAAFNSNVQPPPAVNMVDDQWANIPSLCTLIGSPADPKPEDLPSYLANVHAVDFVRQERIRARVDAIIKDPATATNLKAWYPSWCKRPAFHDDYLPTFNLPHVHLVHTDGKGIQRISKNGPVTNDGTEYPVDVLIWSTGFRTPVVGTEVRGNMRIQGRGGKSLDEKMASNAATLHGVVSRDFPNLFWPGPNQAGVTVNQSLVLQELSKHVAYIIAETCKHAPPPSPSQDSKSVTVEPYLAAEEGWAMLTLSKAASFAGMQGCTPGYLNGEGAFDGQKTMEEQMKAARAAPWGSGLLNYLEVIEAWRAKGGLEGLEVKVG